MSPATNSSRWCPTTEQLMILEEMYRGGIKTPSASQIQQITAHLSLYGKIEGKNVFYWFQNHKARDRQKLRRRLSQQLRHQPPYHHNRLLGYLELPPPLHPLAQPSHTSIGLLPHVGGVEDGSTQKMSYTWKVDDLQEDKPMVRSYVRDWMMRLNVGPTPPCCHKPLKTLELFPITATALKDNSTSIN